MQKLPAAALIILLTSFSAFAHREDYIDETLVFQTVEKGAIEPEYWFDIGHRPDSDFNRHNLALEYGITDHLMIDGRLTVDNPENARANLNSARLETRFRFTEEGDWPVDVAFSAEMNTRRLENGQYQYGLEPRLVLSKDFAKINFTLNVAEELPVNRGAPGVELASGARYDVTKLFQGRILKRIRSESRGLRTVRDRDGVLAPQFSARQAVFIFAAPSDCRSYERLGLLRLAWSLAIARLPAVAFLVVVHRTILAALFATGRLVRRKRNRAHHCD